MADEQIATATDTTIADTSSATPKKQRAPRRSKEEMAEAAATKAAKQGRVKGGKADANLTATSSTGKSNRGTVAKKAATVAAQAGRTTQKAVTASDEFADLMELEEENKRLRKALAEKLREENADLRKRLGA